MTVFYIIYAIWLLSEILLNRLLHSSKQDKKGADKNSLQLIWITILIAIPLSIVIASNYFLPIAHTININYAGLVIILLGMIIRFMAVYSLGRMFTVDVTFRKEHQLKQDGMYKYVRHPSYTGSLVSFIGFGLSLNNWLSLITAVVPVFIVFMRRIKIEESLLTSQLGEQYINYKKHTAALIPFLF